MKRRHVSLCCVAMGIYLASVLPTASTAVAQPGIGERIGQGLDQGLSRLGDELQEGWQSLRQGVDKMGVQARVYSRLHWDKQLAGSELDVEVAEGGVITLRGRVADTAAKEKAIELAQDTIGVTRVMDGLAVRQPPEPTDAPTER